MLTILCATRNPKKGKELRRLLKGAPVRIATLQSFPEIPLVRENGKTFEANAVKKAVQTSRHIPLPVLADDSGLEVQVLGWRPGVYSARFALRPGSGRALLQSQNDAANNRKLLRLMRTVPKSWRRARFICSLSFAVHGHLIRTFEGRCRGSIAFSLAGNTGFGYDALFIPEGYSKTLAQLGPQIKDRLSHRTKAVTKFRDWMERNKTKVIS